MNEVKRQEKKSDKKYLLEQYMINLGKFPMFLSAPLQILATYVIIKKNIWTKEMDLTYTLFLVVLSLTLYVLTYILPPKVREILAKEHPEYKLN